MKKWEDVVNCLQVNDLLNKEVFPKKEEKKSNTIVWVLAIIGAITAVAAIAYAVYRYMTPDYLDDFEDDFDDDFEDDFFDDEDEDEVVKEAKTE